MVNLFYPKDSFSIAGHIYNTTVTTGLSRWLNSKESTCNAGVARDTSSIPGLGRSPGGGHGNLLQYSFLENPHGKGSLVGYSPWGHKESNTADVTEHPCRVITYRDVMMKRNLWILLKMES